MSNSPSTLECDDGTRFPPPRDFQVTAHEALRQGFKEGHKNQIVCSPTGSGKSYLGLRICNEAIQRNKRAVFLCDRTTLINQTSATADRYGMLHHGIIQANHWRSKPQELFQIASVQTIAKRGFWPELDVLVVDESHSCYKAWVDYAMETKAVVIGLSATPFTKGLGKIFTNVINAATMNELTQSGVLVPMRIFSCHKPDMTGAKTIGGEWSDKAAEERELKIVGDVVSDWHKFAENRKTIVFGATIAHCEELCRQFIASGVMSAVFTSDTTTKDREVLLKEYSKPNSHLKVLISVEALCLDTKTEILTKQGWKTNETISYDDEVASFITESGEIEFNKPLKIIKRKLGINESFVSNEGRFVNWRVTNNHRMLVHKGIKSNNKKWVFKEAENIAGKNCITMPSSGMSVPDILSVTQEKESNTKIERRISSNSYSLRKNGMNDEDSKIEAKKRINARSMLKYKNPNELTLDDCRLIGFWIGDGSKQNLQTGGITYTFTQSLRYSNIVKWFDELISRIGLDFTRRVINKDKIKLATNNVIKWQIGRGTGFGDQKKNGLYYLEPYLNKNGSKLFWAFTKDQYLALIEGFDLADGIHYRNWSRPETNPRITNTNYELLSLLQGIGLCRGCHVTISEGSNSDSQRELKGYKRIYTMSVNPHKEFITSAATNSKVEINNEHEDVWCVETKNGTIITRRNGRPLIMGNCKGFDVPDIGCICDARPLRKSLSTAIQMWGRGARSSPETGKTDFFLLDFSGNIVRFFEDFSDFYFNGLGKLDDGEKLDKTVREKEEFEPKGCPACGFKPFHKRCMKCGHEKVVKEITEAIPGHMKEIFIGTGSKQKKLADNAEHLWSQLCTYARIHSKPENQSARAWHLFKQITGTETKWAFSKAPTVEITSNVESKIRQMNIQYSKRKLP